jgi:hypothetical protein
MLLAAFLFHVFRAQHLAGDRIGEHMDYPAVRAQEANFIDQLLFVAAQPNAQRISLISIRRGDQQPKRLDEFMQSDFFPRLRGGIAFMLRRFRVKTPRHADPNHISTAVSAVTDTWVRCTRLMHRSGCQSLSAGKAKSRECKAGVPHRIRTRFNTVNAR